MRLNLSVEDLPRFNRYRQPQRPVEAVQTNLTALPALNWAPICTAERSESGQVDDVVSSVASRIENSMLLLFPYRSSNNWRQNVTPLNLFLWLVCRKATGAASTTGSDLLSTATYGHNGSGQRNLLPIDLRQLSGVTTNSGDRPAASAEALQRHAILPAADQRVRPTALQQPRQPRPLYPSFDSAPLAPIQYGFESAALSAPLAPGLGLALRCAIFGALNFSLVAVLSNVDIKLVLSLKGFLV